MAYFLGIDAGGSKTTCVIGDEKSSLASANAGGSNVVRCGEIAARAALHSAILEACSTAKVKLPQITRLCIGIAGAARPAIDSIVRSAISEIYAGEILLVGDMVIAMEAAFGSGPGVIVISGTGSIAYARNSAGQTARAGGWGFAISDEGSGHWIGRTAIAAVMRARDESHAPPQALSDAILRAWHLNSLDDLIRAANSPNADFPSLCPAVLGLEEDDPLARAVLTQAGMELARFAHVVISRLRLGAEPVPVAMSGGVFRNSAVVRNVFISSLDADRHNAVIRTELVDPVQGALRLARTGTGTSERAKI